MADEPYVIGVRKRAEDRNVGVFGGNWHSNFSFLEQPPAGSLLSAVEIPEYGGDTVWSNQIAAYETLPEDLKTVVEGRSAIHVGKPHGVKFSPKGNQRSTVKIVCGDPEADREMAHPAVRTHPESGRKSLFVNPGSSGMRSVRSSVVVIAGKLVILLFGTTARRCISR